MTARFSDTKIHQAYDNWCRSFGAYTWLEFWKFLGGYEGYLGVLATWKLTPEGEQRAEMLLGPHARTIVTAYFLQHPELTPPPLLNVPSVED